MSAPGTSQDVEDVANLDDALRSMTFEPEIGRETTSQAETVKQAISPLSTSSTDFSPLPYRPATLITVHRKQYVQQYSDSSSESDLNYPVDETAPTQSSPHGEAIGNYVNVGMIPVDRSVS